MGWSLGGCWRCCRDELLFACGGPCRWGMGWTPYCFRKRSVSFSTSACLRRATLVSSSAMRCRRLASASSAFSRSRRRRRCSFASFSACALRRAVSASSSHCARGSAAGGAGWVPGLGVLGGVVWSLGNDCRFTSFADCGFVLTGGGG